MLDVDLYFKWNAMLKKNPKNMQLLFAVFSSVYTDFRKGLGKVLYFGKYWRFSRPWYYYCYKKSVTECHQGQHLNMCSFYF